MFQQRHTPQIAPRSPRRPKLLDSFDFDDVAAAVDDATSPAAPKTVSSSSNLPQQNKLLFTPTPLDTHAATHTSLHRVPSGVGATTSTSVAVIPGGASAEVPLAVTPPSAHQHLGFC